VSANPRITVARTLDYERVMLYLFGLFLHLFGSHSRKPYGNDDLPEGQYHCMICDKTIDKDSKLI